MPGSVTSGSTSMGNGCVAASGARRGGFQKGEIRLNTLFCEVFIKTAHFCCRNARYEALSHPLFHAVQPEPCVHKAPFHGSTSRACL